MIRRLGTAFAAFFRKTTPDPFVLAIFLTWVVFALAWLIEGKGPIEIIRAWQGDSGFWSLLGFGMQMVLILVTGHALTSAPIARAALARLARLPKTGPGATAMVAAVAIGTGLLNWGLGLIVGAILARDVGRRCKERGITVQYPLLAAAGYTGMMCWHGGLSGTAPLKVTMAADVEKFLGPDLAKTVDPIPFSRTVLSLDNLIVTGGLFVLIPLLCYALAPRQGDAADGIDRFEPGDGGEIVDPPAETSVERFERSKILLALVVLPLAVAIYFWARDRGLDQLDPDALNLIFLTAGLALHGSVARYGVAVGQAVKGAAGIVLQFPFYAGIMGVMRTTGLAATFAKAMVDWVPASLFPVATFLSAAIINLFVPSGGGQWAVQGPIAVRAALGLDIAPEVAVMAVAYGDQITNMLQPFWALPLLAITGVRARDVIGYTAVLMMAGGAWIVLCLLAL